MPASCVKLRHPVSQRFKVIVCRGPECGDRRDSKVVHAAFQAVIAARSLGASVELGWQSCFGRCTQGPNVLVSELAAGAPPPRFVFAAMPAARRGASALYNGCTPDDVTEIVEEHVLKGQLVRRLIQPISARRPVEVPTAPPPSDDPDRNRDGES